MSAKSELTAAVERAIANRYGYHAARDYSQQIGTRELRDLRLIRDEFLKRRQTSKMATSSRADGAGVV